MSQGKIAEHGQKSFRALVGAQFLGAFAGGLLGGWLLSLGDTGSVFAWLGGCAGLWLLLAFSMKAPRYLKSKVVSLQNLDDGALGQFIERARALDGVSEVSVYEADRVAYLKVEKSFDDKQLNALLAD